MSSMHIAVGILLASSMFFGAQSGQCQTYPTKPIRIITSPPGGSADFVGRLVAQGISGPLGQPVIVENRPNVAIPDAVSNGRPDGYTLGLVGQSFWISPLLEKLTYDPINDFSPITLTNSAPIVLVVHPSLPVQSVRDLISIAKAKPGQLNYASTGTGGPAHLAAELFNSMAGVNIVRINYGGTGPALNDLIAGQVQLMFANAAGVLSFIDSGRLRALAVTSPRPTMLVPGVPPLATFLPGYESLSTQSVVAPAKTPTVVVNRLNQEIGRVLNSSEVKEKFLRAGIEAASNSPEELTSMMKSEMSRLAKLIKELGMRN